MKNLILLKILSLFINFISISALDCQISNDNNLTVPAEGCTLPSSGGKETILNTLTLNGILLINSHNHLKYKSIICQEGISAIHIKSNYEKIIVEDTDMNICQNPCNLSLVFQSKSLNTIYSVKQIDNMQELTFLENPMTLYRGVKIVISSHSGNTEIAEVSKVVDKKVILKQKLSNNHLPTEMNGHENKLPSVLVIDENRALIHIYQFTLFNQISNCFQINPVFTSDFEKGSSFFFDFDFSSGALFVDQKQLMYDALDKQFLLNTIFLNTKEQKSITKLNTSVGDVVFIGQFSEIQLFSQNSHSDLYFMRMEQALINIINNENEELNFQSLFFNNFDGTINFQNLMQINVDQSYFLNSNLVINSNVQNTIHLVIKHSVLMSSSIRGYDEFHFKQFEMKQTQIIGKVLDLTYINSDEDIILSEMLFNGKNLLKAIEIQDEKRKKTLRLSINDSKFINFISSEIPLISSTVKSSNIQDEIQTFGQTKYFVHLLNNHYNLNINNPQKVINLPNLVLTSYKFQKDYDFFLIPLEMEIFQKINKNRLEKSVIYHKPLFESHSITTFQFDLPQNHYIEAKTDQFSQTWYSTKNYFFLEDTVYKAKLFNNNKQLYTPTTLSFIISQSNYKIEKSSKMIKLCFETSQPILSIFDSKKLVSGQLSLDKFVQLDPQDGCINISNVFFETLAPGTILNVKLNLILCKKGWLLEDQTCVKQCESGKIILNNICLEAKEIDFYYMKDSVYQPCTSNNCKTCSSSTECLSCVSDMQGVDKKYQCLKNDFQTYFTQKNSKNISEKCPENCIFCDGGVCQECQYGFELKDSKCNGCQKGSFFSEKTNECQQCELGCIECQQNQNECIQCMDGYILKSGMCIKSCGQKEYYDGTECQPCYENCQECKGPTMDQCLSCPLGSSFYKNMCIKFECSKLQFGMTLECEDCFDQSNPNGCFGPYPHSHICDKGYYAEIGSSKCKKCDEQCSECDSESSFCTTCSNNLSLINGLCLKPYNELITSEDSDSDQESAIIIGSVIGCIAALILTAILIYGIRRYKNNKKVNIQNNNNIATSNQLQTIQETETKNQLDDQQVTQNNQQQNQINKIKQNV